MPSFPASCEPSAAVRKKNNSKMKNEDNAEAGPLESMRLELFVQALCSTFFLVRAEFRSGLDHLLQGE
jgi:hypothetical protein